MNNNDPSRLLIDILHKADYYVSHRNAKALEPYGVTMYQAMSLIYIAQHEDSMSVNQRAIERYTRLSNPGVSKLVSALVNHGYVERTPDQHDARNYILKTTESGKAQAEIFLAVIENADRETTAKLSAREYAQLAALLNKMTGR